MPTGATEYLPRYDVLARATVDLKAGDTVGTDHSKTLRALMCPARSVEGNAPVPLHMAARNSLLADVGAGELLTVDKIQAPANSTLWALRAEQDQHFCIERLGGIPRTRT
jgi:predicted homoserine dehydrogenase-like protein